MSCVCGCEMCAWMLASVSLGVEGNMKMCTYGCGGQKLRLGVFLAHFLLYFLSQGL